MRKNILLSILFFGIVSITHAQDFSFERKVIMIDSAYDARIKKYLKKCFPEYKVTIKVGKDSLNLCSVEDVFMEAPDVSEDQIAVLEIFMVNMANYYCLNNEPVLFDYGFVPGSIETNFDRMFNRKEIYVTSLDKVTTHSSVIHLISVFNKVIYHYLVKTSASR